MEFFKRFEYFLGILDRFIFKASNPFGLDVSDFSIEVMEIGNGLLGPKLISYGRQELESGIVENGVIHNKEKLIENIKNTLKTAYPKSIKNNNCVLSLPESKIFTYIFNLPIGLKSNQIRRILAYEAEKVIPFPPEEIYFDFQIVSQGQKELLQEVFFAAVPKKIVNDFYEVLQEAGLNPLVFDMESVALSRILIEKYNPGTGIMIVDIGARTTILSIFDQGGLRLSFVFSIAGNKFTEIIANELKISFEKAEELKKTTGPDFEKIGLILKPQFQLICGEIKQSIKYYENQSKNKIEKLILVGGSSLLFGLDKYFTDNLGLEVEVGNPFLKVKDTLKLSQTKNSVLFAAVLGLAFRAASKNPVGSEINLFPKDLFPETRWYDKKII